MVKTVMACCLGVLFLAPPSPDAPLNLLETFNSFAVTAVFTITSGQQTISDQ